jgi:copper chaperone
VFEPVKRTEEVYNMNTVKLDVPGISCNHCRMAIEGAVGKLGGVDNVNVDVPAKTVTVEFDPGTVTLDAVKRAIEDQGYDIGQE